MDLANEEITKRAAEMASGAFNFIDECELDRRASLARRENSVFLAALLLAKKLKERDGLMGAKAAIFAATGKYFIGYVGDDQLLGLIHSLAGSLAQDTPDEDNEFGPLLRPSEGTLINDALDILYRRPCDLCGGDCASANPPVAGCPVRAAMDARAAVSRLLASVTTA